MLTEAIFCMAFGIYFEGRTESFYGQMLIANVIGNRVKSNRYPNNTCDVITQKKQFSFLNNVTKDNRLEIKNAKAFYTAIAVAEYYTKHKPVHHYACHYATIETNNNWTLEYDLITTTANHSFYEGGCNDIKGRKRANTQKLVKRRYTRKTAEKS